MKSKYHRMLPFNTENLANFLQCLSMSTRLSSTLVQLGHPHILQTVFFVDMDSLYESHKILYSSNYRYDGK